MLLLWIAFLLLDHPHWQRRDAAAKCLSPANAITLPLLEYVELNGSVEAGRRACRIVCDYYASNAYRFAQDLGKLPWVDGEVVHQASEWLELARQRGTHGGEGWPDYRVATRLLVEERIATRQPYQQMIRDLWRAEYQWRLQNWYWGR